MKMDFKVFSVQFLIVMSNIFVIICDKISSLDEGGSTKTLSKSASSEFSHHELITPVIYKNNKKLVSTFDKDGHVDDIAIHFHSADGNFMLDLKRNRNLFSKSYIEKSYTDPEIFNIKRPHRKKLAKHCHYHGSVRGVKHSMVAISTCQGISGFIQAGTEAYHIEPAVDVDKHTHRLYKDSHSLHKPNKCGAHEKGHSTRLNETRQIEHKNLVLKRSKRRVREPYDANVNTRYVEMYIVNDFKTYDSNSRLLQYQIWQTQSIVNIVSRLYQPFNIYIALVGIENWTKQEMFTITQEANSTLENFLHYRKNRINPKHQNDNAQLITGTTFSNGIVGKAIKGTICTYQYSGGVNLNLATPGQTAATIAHELGHNFGMDHDNYTTCQCKDTKCIMAATSGGVNIPRHWSSCSMLALQEAFEMGMDYCLRNKPDVLYDGPVCGNGFTEEGEECDCGLSEQCNNKCCNASTCKLTSGSSCATGACCDLSKCQPKEAASLCRPSVGECDLPEFCWGDSPFCPDDVYLQDGVQCHSGKSYCYNGTCKTHTGQCKLLWGNTGRVSDPVCFKHLNTNGSKHGNCGYNWTTSTYEPCLRDDVMCGLLHCVHQNEKLMFWKDNLAHATPATFLTIGQQTYICRGAMLDVGLDMPDPGMVPNGAKCEENRICVNQRCTPLSHLRIPECEGGCSDRGKCNSRGHCHCDEGFGAPICDVTGNGGSVDSGPIKIDDDKSLLIGLLVFFLVILPLLGLVGFMMYYFRADILAWWRKQINNKQLSQGQNRPLHPTRAPPKREEPPAAAKVQKPIPPRPINITENPERKPTYQNTPVRPPKPLPATPQPDKPQPVTHPHPQPTKFQPPRPHAAARNGAVQISGPVLTDSTHKNTKAHVQLSPVANQKHSNAGRQQPVANQKPAGPQAQTNLPQKPERAASPPPPSYNSIFTNAGTTNDNKPPSDDNKSRFPPIFKMPSFGMGQKKEATKSPKLETRKQDNTPAEGVVKKRELTREISSPVLISTTDRRSKHLVKLENLNVKKAQGDFPSCPSPPVPPHVNLSRSESDTARRNRPLPSRPLSMPESENGEDLEMPTNTADIRRSMAAPSSSPRMVQHPPPPPVKPNIDKTRQNIEDVLSALDDIQLDIPSDSSPDLKERSNHSHSDQNDNITLQKRSPHTKDVKQKQKKSVSASKSGSTDSAKKPMLPAKVSATKSKSDPKPNKQQWSEVKKPIFNPQSRPGFSGKPKMNQSDSKSGTSQSKSSKPGISQSASSKKPSAEKRKDSTDSIDDDPSSGAASVSGLAKRFEVQKKPLLGGNKEVKKTQSQGETTKAPMTPPKPKPTARQVRSVNV